MNLTCTKCNAEFEHDVFIGWCPECQESHKMDRSTVADKTNPMPGAHAVGKFTNRECPASVHNPFNNENVCCLCGCPDLSMGYGFAGGYGLGSYNYCLGCGSILDFSEDKE